MSTSTTTDTRFREDVLMSENPVLVDFWADWCGPCKSITPVLDELGAEYAGKADVKKLNVDENPQKTAEFGIRAIPTMILFKNGKAVETLRGAQPKGALQAAIDRHIDPALH